MHEYLFAKYVGTKGKYTVLLFLSTSYSVLTVMQFTPITKGTTFHFNNKIHCVILIFYNKLIMKAH